MAESNQRKGQQFNLQVDRHGMDLDNTNFPVTRCNCSVMRNHPRRNVYHVAVIDNVCYIKHNIAIVVRDGERFQNCTTNNIHPQFQRVLSQMEKVRASRH